jgi:MFS family permease
LVQPVFAVFVKEQIVGATIVTVGTAAAIYWILKSFLQIPVANYLDKTEGELDDFRALIIGLFLAAITALSFLAVTKTWHLYLVEILHAVAFAFYIPAWSAIFSRHVDKEHVSFDWSLDNTVAGLSAGVSGFLGGVIVGQFGFSAVFILAGVFSLLSAFILLLAPQLILPRKTIGDPKIIKDKTPVSMGQ